MQERFWTRPRRMPSARAVVALAGVVAATAVVAGCGGGSDTSGASGSDEPIRIGTLMSVTGVLAPYGVPERQAIELGVDAANDGGGIAGRRLDWTSYDPKGDTATAVSQTRRLLDQDRVDVVAGGGASSGVALAMDQILSPAGVFFASGEADPRISAPAADHPITFQTTLTSQLVVDRMLEWAQAQGYRKIAFLADSSDYGQSGLTAAKASADRYGLQIDGISYDPSVSDLTPQLTNAARGDPDAYINWTATPSGVVYMKNANALGLNRRAQIMVGFTYSNARFMQQAGAAARGVVASASKVTVADDLPESDPQKATLARFARDYEAAYDQPIDIYAAEAYDAIGITVEALQRTRGDTDAEKMAEALESEPYVGVLGTFRYSADNHFGLSLRDVVMTRWNGSAFELVD